MLQTDGRVVLTQRAFGGNPPPPLKAGACFYFFVCFDSLLAFIFTVHAFAMFSQFHSL